MVPKGKRAASRLVSGKAYEKAGHTTINLMPGLIELAEQYGLCSRYGRSGKPISQYIEEKLIEDIRKKEKERENLPVNQ